MTKMTKDQEMLWDNDPAMFRDKPGFSEKVDLQDFRIHALQKHSPEEAYPRSLDKRKLYEEFLKNPK